MKDKYYVPSIEEIYVGFECEYQEPNSKEFENDELSERDVAYLLVYPDKARVKYLDQKDIESLGWLESNSNYGEYNFKLNNYTLIFWSNTTENYTTNIYIKQESGLGLHCFKGTIKNKSELVKLMSQLNIKLK